MASTPQHLTLPRRVSGYFLLFFVGAMLWSTVGSMLVSHSATRRRAENACLDRLQRASQHIEAEGANPAEARLQALVERFQAEGGLEYCATVSPDGMIMAHSSAVLVGELYQEPAATATPLGEVVRLRLPADSARVAVLEYHAPLRAGNADAGTLQMAFREPEFWNSVVPDSGPLSVLALGPAACMALGIIVLRRLVQPLAAIESQLCRAATAICPAELELSEVPTHGAATRGWNRLVEAHRLRRETSGVAPRAAAALEAASAGHGTSPLDSLPDGVAVTSKEGRISFANSAMGAICGVPAGNGGLTGKTVEELFDLRSRQEAHALLASNSHGRTVVADLPIALQGSPRVLRVARHPYWDTDGRADGSRHVWSVRDITQQQLVSQTRDQFLQTAAHELRTPLATIKAYSETLSLDDDIDTERQKEFYNVINSEATRLARLIEDLLNVSSMEAGALSAAREEVDVGRLVDDVIAKARPMMEQKGLDFQTLLPQKWPKTHLDKDKVATSLVNVLGNAAKYSPAGGRVVFRVTVDEKHMTLAVEDTGIGISAEELPNIATKFFRSSDPRVREQLGSGLGLALVKEVARLHGGAMDIRSEINQGTTVKITLPLA